MADNYESIIKPSLEKEGTAVDAASTTELNAEAQEAVVETSTQVQVIKRENTSMAENSDVADKKEPSVQPSPKRSKKEGAAAANTSELSIEAHKSAEKAKYGIRRHDLSAPPPRECIQEWHDKSPKMTIEEIVIIARQKTAEWEETDESDDEDDDDYY